MEAGDDVDDKEIKENEQMLEDDEGTYMKKCQKEAMKTATAATTMEKI